MYIHIERERERDRERERETERERERDTHTYVYICTHMYTCMARAEPTRPPMEPRPSIYLCDLSPGLPEAPRSLW